MMTGRYDSARDVVQKALRGTGLTIAEAASRAGLNALVLEQWLQGCETMPDLSLLASALGLNGQALARLDLPFTPPPLPTGVTRLELPFDDETVNAWLMEREGEMLLIDTGPRPEALRTALGERHPDLVLLTHTHSDHVGGLSLLRQNGERILHGSDFSGNPVPWGGGTLTALPLPGHHPAGWGYAFFYGNKPQWLATGDALFAGSMGGCPNPASFALACDTLGKALAAMGSPEVLLLPGHGPASTIQIEKRENVFAPRWHARS